MAARSWAQFFFARRRKSQNRIQNQIHKESRDCCGFFVA